MSEEKMSEKKEGTSLLRARLEFQGKISSIERGSTVDFMSKEGRRKKYDYVDLAQTLDTVLPILTECGLLLKTESTYREIFNTKNIDKSDSERLTIIKEYVRTVYGINATLTHAESGEQDVETLWHEQSVTDIKDRAAQITYLRRYAIFTLLGLSAKGEDDDAGSGGAPKGAPERKHDPERKPDQRPSVKAPDKKPADKKSEDEIKNEFTELGLDKKEVREALEAVNIKTMVAAINLRKKFETTQLMMDAIAPSKGGEA